MLRPHYRVTASMKRELIESFGGKCQRCGYSRCPRALHFHHIDPTDKEEWSKGRGGAAWSEVKAHPEHFMLLCANCHIEEHERIDEANRIYLDCRACGKRFRAKAARIKEGKDKYCSRRCQHDKRLSDAPDRIEGRFRKFIKHEGDCWIWTGAMIRTTPVLGTTEPDGRHLPKTARRIALEIAGRPVPKGRSILPPVCGNTRCVNPDHLTLGTPKRVRPASGQGELFA